MRRARIFSLSAVLLSLGYVLALIYNFQNIPQASYLASSHPAASARRGPRDRYDVIIVLGNPSEYDGSPSPEQRARLLEGVREYRAGVAPRMITTGAAVLNQYREGHMMAMEALALGVPPSAILEETQARNTVQNIFYSAQIMREHGWHSAEVVSSPSHLPRTALILEHYRGPGGFAWRTHAAPWPAHYWWHVPLRYFLEANACLLFRLFGFPGTRFLPGGH